MLTGRTQYCESQLPQGKRIKAFRSDSAGYQADIFNYMEAGGILFAIGADLDAAVIRAIDGISDWRPYEGMYIGETVHSMNKTKKAFRLIVIRRHYQTELLGEGDEKLRYTVIASNRAESMEEVVKWYNQRGQCSENRIKELKIGFGMERMPCGQFEANAVFFRIGVLAYNIGRLFVRETLGDKWERYQVQTLRWKLYGRAGKIVFHGRHIWLKVSRQLYELFSRVRLRTWEFSTS